MKWKPKLIPRTTFKGRRRTQALDAYNRPTNTTEEFCIDNAGLQPLSGREQQTMDSGYRDKVVYKLFTTTPVLTVEEASSSLADQVLVKGKWCTAVKSQSWEYGIQSHYEVMLVEENERP